MRPSGRSLFGLGFGWRFRYRACCLLLLAGFHCRRVGKGRRDIPFFSSEFLIVDGGAFAGPAAATWANFLHVQVISSRVSRFRANLVINRPCKAQAGRVRR